MQTNNPNIPVGYHQQSLDAQSQPAHGNASGLDFIVHESREAEFERALKHTGKVKLLKIVLPIMAVLIILGISAALIINSLLNPGVSVDNIAISDGKLVMENPQLNGFDSNQRPYNLTANKAIQDADNPTLVQLQKIIASLPVDDKILAEITAGQGLYDADAKTLILDKKVHVITNNGMSLTLEDADVNIGAGTLSTDKTILATSPQADISAKSLVVHDSGNHLIFEGNVRMTLRPDAVKEGNEQ